MTGAATPLTLKVRRLLLDAAGVCGGSEDGARLRELARRLDAPLKIALAGLIKAGKSTLLNALLAERVAATDAAECTRMITWYEFGEEPAAQALLRNGSTANVGLASSGSSTRVDVGSLVADEVRRIVVSLPRPSLRELTVIDTPGIASLSVDVSRRTQEFLRPDTDDEPADAVVFLMRQVHESDVNFLEAFHDVNFAAAAPVNAIGVLSRADEIAPGRADSLDVAALLSRRYRREPRLRTLVQTVVPVSGLLAETGATLLDDEFDAIARIAGLPNSEVQDLVRYADGFLKHDPRGPVTFHRRRELLRRLGMYGVRLSIELVTSGEAVDRSTLSEGLVQRSGIVQLRQVLASQFTERASMLKAQTALRAVESALERIRRADAERLRHEIERLSAGAHGFAELRLLNSLRVGDLPMEDDQRERMEALLGAEGGSLRRRLRLVDEARDGEVQAALQAQLDMWRRMAENPFADPALKRAAQTLRRTCEGMRAGNS